jgi:hypothetical protein
VTGLAVDGVVVDGQRLELGCAVEARSVTDRHLVVVACAGIASPDGDGGERRSAADD